MGLFRSETMKHGTLVLPADRARAFIELLGSKAHIQFLDMNANTMYRQYKRYVQRIEEMERILRFLFDEIKKLPGTKLITADVDIFLETDHGYQLDKVEEALQKLYEQFKKFNENNSDLMTQKNAAIEEHAVAKAALSSLGPDGRASRTIDTSDLELAVSNVERVSEGGLMGFSNVAGVLVADDQEKFARTIFRATRGNAFTHFESIDSEILDIKTGKAIQKVVFVIYFQAGTGLQSALRDKILRICQAYSANLYDWPKSSTDAGIQISRLDVVIQDKAKALEAYEDFFVSESSALLEVHRPGGGSLIEDYRLFCSKEKAIYATLNMYEGTEAMLRSNCWFPEAEEEEIRRMLLSFSTPNQVSAFLLTDQSKPKQKPPTYFRTTEFTAVFQSFVDTYGVPRYKEANPALLTMMTFPFLFGVMYGDIGHGALVLAFGLFLVGIWKKLKDTKEEMVQTIAAGRYMIVLMGLFAVYAGFMYNDFFSLGLDIFGTRYERSHQQGNTIYYKFKEGSSPYPFGFDPAWKGASNELLFFNSFKMKFSVIVGLIQMCTGIIIKGLNAIYFNDSLTFIFEFIPQIIFMLGLVGFLDLLIFYKWATPIIPNYSVNKNGTSQDNKPLIINTLIQMVMYAPPEQVMFYGQEPLMKACLILMVVSIPLMLLFKPFIRKSIHKRKRDKIQPKYQADDVDLIEGGGAAHEEDDDVEFDFGEEMIHQMIETIEFVLGSISNTASYLRLWALSLAHQQLSLVFFNLLIKNVLSLRMNAVIIGIMLFFAFAAFACITFGVMLCMDSLECFLHALRLQWVEFQNKFYKADGYAFVPFSFKETLTHPES